MDNNNVKLQNLGAELTAAKHAYDCLGLANVPSDPIEAAKQTIAYKQARIRFEKADKALDEALENNNE